MVQTTYNQPGVFISFEESIQELVQNVASLGWDLKTLQATNQFALDYIHIERSQFQETGTYDLEAIFARVGYAIDRIGAKRVVLDTYRNFVRPLIRQCPGAGRTQAAISLAKRKKA